MKITPNIGLTTVGISQADKDMDFEDWRILIAGEEKSNMTIIDTEIDKKIEPTNIKQGENVTVVVNGKDITISSTATGDITKEEVDQKIKEHNESNLSHTDLRNKTSIIKTDGRDNEFLCGDGTYKEIQGGTGGVTVFDIDNYEVFTATEETNTFTIPNMSVNKVITIVKDNLEMIKDVDYTIDKKSGVVTLNFTLAKEKKVYYKVVSGADSVVVYDEDEITEDFQSDTDTLNSYISKIATLKDRNNNKLLPRTVFEAVQSSTGKKLNETLDEKLDKTDIVNTTTQVESDKKALNAVQANPDVEGTLAKQIGDLNTKVGDTTTLKTDSKEVVGAINENVDEITALQTGKADKNPTGYSPSIVSIGGLGTINTRDNSTDTPPISDGWGTFLSSGGSRDFQIGYKWNDSMARLWYRVHKGDAEYRDWKELATTDKIDILVSPKPLYKISNNNSYTINNQHFLKFTLVKSDGSAFEPTTSFISACETSISSGTSGSSSALALNANSYNSSGIPLAIGSAVLDGNTVLIVGIPSGAVRINVSGVMVS